MYWYTVTGFNEQTLMLMNMIRHSLELFFVCMSKTGQFGLNGALDFGVEFMQLA